MNTEAALLAPANTWSTLASSHISENGFLSDNAFFSPPDSRLKQAIQVFTRLGSVDVDIAVSKVLAWRKKELELEAIASVKSKRRLAVEDHTATVLISLFEETLQSISKSPIAALDSFMSQSTFDSVTAIAFDGVKNYSREELASTQESLTAIQCAKVVGLAAVGSRFGSVSSTIFALINSALSSPKQEITAIFFVRCLQYLRLDRQNAGEIASFLESVVALVQRSSKTQMPEKQRDCLKHVICLSVHDSLTGTRQWQATHPTSVHSIDVILKKSYEWVKKSKHMAHASLLSASLVAISPDIDVKGPELLAIFCRNWEKEKELPARSMLLRAIDTLLSAGILDEIGGVVRWPGVVAETESVCAVVFRKAWFGTEIAEVSSAKLLMTCYVLNAEFVGRRLLPELSLCSTPSESAGCGPQSALVHFLDKFRDRHIGKLSRSVPRLLFPVESRRGIILQLFEKVLAKVGAPKGIFPPVIPLKGRESRVVETSRSGWLTLLELILKRLVDISGGELHRDYFCFLFNVAVTGDPTLSSVAIETIMTMTDSLGPAAGCFCVAACSVLCSTLPSSLTRVPTDTNIDSREIAALDLLLQMLGSWSDNLSATAKMAVAVPPECCIAGPDLDHVEAIGVLALCSFDYAVRSMGVKILATCKEISSYFHVDRSSEVERRPVIEVVDSALLTLMDVADDDAASHSHLQNFIGEAQTLDWSIRLGKILWRVTSSGCCDGAAKESVNICLSQSLSYAASIVKGDVPPEQRSMQLLFSWSNVTAAAFALSPTSGEKLTEGAEPATLLEQIVLGAMGESDVTRQCCANVLMTVRSLEHWTYILPVAQINFMQLMEKDKSKKKREGSLREALAQMFQALSSTLLYNHSQNGLDSFASLAQATLTYITSVLPIISSPENPLGKSLALRHSTAITIANLGKFRSLCGSYLDSGLRQSVMRCFGPMCDTSSAEFVSDEIGLSSETLRFSASWTFSAAVQGPPISDPAFASEALRIAELMVSSADPVRQEMGVAAFQALVTADPVLCRPIFATSRCGDASKSENIFLALAGARVEGRTKLPLSLPEIAVEALLRVISESEHVRRKSWELLYAVCLDAEQAMGVKEGHENLAGRIAGLRMASIASAETMACDQRRASSTMASSLPIWTEDFITAAADALTRLDSKSRAGSGILNIINLVEPWVRNLKLNFEGDEKAYVSVAAIAAAAVERFPMHVARSFSKLVPRRDSTGLGTLLMFVLTKLKNVSHARALAFIIGRTDAIDAMFHLASVLSDPNLHAQLGGGDNDSGLSPAAMALVLLPEVCCDSSAPAISPHLAVFLHAAVMGSFSSCLVEVEAARKVLSLLIGDFGICWQGGNGRIASALVHTADTKRHAELPQLILHNIDNPFHPFSLAHPVASQPGKATKTPPHLRLWPPPPLVSLASVTEGDPALSLFRNWIRSIAVACCADDERREALYHSWAKVALGMINSPECPHALIQTCIKIISVLEIDAAWGFTKLMKWVHDDSVHRHISFQTGSISAPSSFYGHSSLLSASMAATGTTTAISPSMLGASLSTSASSTATLVAEVFAAAFMILRRDSAAALTKRPEIFWSVVAGLFMPPHPVYRVVLRAVRDLLEICWGGNDPDFSRKIIEDSPHRTTLFRLIGSASPKWDPPVDSIHLLLLRGVETDPLVATRAMELLLGVPAPIGSSEPNIQAIVMVTLIPWLDSKHVSVAQACSNLGAMVANEGNLAPVSQAFTAASPLKAIKGANAGATRFGLEAIRNVASCLLIAFPALKWAFLSHLSQLLPKSQEEHRSAILFTLLSFLQHLSAKSMLPEPSLASSLCPAITQAISTSTNEDATSYGSAVLAVLMTCNGAAVPSPSPSLFRPARRLSIDSDPYQKWRRVIGLQKSETVATAAARLISAGAPLPECPVDDWHEPRLCQRLQDERTVECPEGGVGGGWLTRGPSAKVSSLVSRPSMRAPKNPRSSQSFSLSQTPSVTMTSPSEKEEDEELMSPLTSQRLPPGWETAVDDTTGDVYYFNLSLGVTQWDPPAGPGESGMSSHAEAVEPVAFNEMALSSITSQSSLVDTPVADDLSSSSFTSSKISVSSKKEQGWLVLTHQTLERARMVNTKRKKPSAEGGLGIMRSKQKSSLAMLPLPPGWERHVAADGRTYFHNVKTQETSWTPPAVTNVVKRAVLAVFNRKDGSAETSTGAAAERRRSSVESVDGEGEWVEYIDTASGNPYWFNKSTQMTQWTNPDLEIKGASDSAAESAKGAGAASPQVIFSERGDTVLVNHRAPENLPPGWESGVDEMSGKVYYWAKATGETTWTLPTESPMIPAESPLPMVSNSPAAGEPTRKVESKFAGVRLAALKLPREIADVGPVFGKKLEHVPVGTRWLPRGQWIPGVPWVVSLLCTILEIRSNESEGLFRIPGAQVEVDKIKNQIDKVQEPQVDKIQVDILATTLKAYFRSLPESILPYAVCVATGRKIKSESDEDDAAILRTQLLDVISVECEATLARLFQLLYRVAKDARNPMNETNLATCFAPSLARAPEDSNAMAAFLDGSLCHSCVRRMIDLQPLLFPN